MTRITRNLCKYLNVCPQHTHTFPTCVHAGGHVTISKHTGRRDVVDKCLVVAAIRVCLRSAEASVGACSEKQPAPLHTSNPGPPPQPDGGGGLNGGSVPAHAAACPVVSADKMWVLGWGWGWGKIFTRVLGGIKGKWERPAASRGSLDPVIFVSVEHLFCIAKSESLKISIYFFLPQAQIKEQLQSCRTVRMPFSIMRQIKVYIYSRA